MKSVARNVWLGAAGLGLVSYTLLAAEPGQVPDRSGVKPQVLSLPSGPGSIEGLGESFEPQLNSGTFSYRVPLKLPPVRQGGAPALALEYSSGNGNGMLGLGWQLKLPLVRRQTDKGLPYYDDRDQFIDETSEELVHLADRSYRCKNEGAFTRYERTETGGWLGRLKGGGTLRYGQTPQARLEWSTNGVYCWMLESSQDLNGNRVEYQYLQDQGQIYPDEIRYGLHATERSEFFRVKFSYETNRPDVIQDCKPRVVIQTRWRLTGVTVFLGERRVRHWRLGYVPHGRVSLLASVALFGDDRSTLGEGAQPNVDFLPPTYFSYTPSLLSSNAAVETVLLSDNLRMAEGLAELVDLNHDGLPDLLYQSGEEWLSLVNPGPGQVWPPPVALQNPPVGTSFGLGRPTTRLVDLRGDGRCKLLLKDDSFGFFYRDFRTAARLDVPVDFPIRGLFDLADPNVQFIDINNDKAMDLMATDDSGFTFLVNGLAEGKENYLLPASGSAPIGAPRAGVQFGLGWQLADMNGDRMQDLVHVIDRDNSEVCLNLGLGQFATPYLMAGGPSEASLSAGSGPQLVDLDQDGLADLVLVENRSVRVWLNDASRRWLEPCTLDMDIPEYQTGQTSVRFADLNGNGSTDVLWHQGQEARLRWVELFPAGKAHLLNHVDTGMGRGLDVTYRSCVDFMVEAVGTTNEWTSVIPFPVPVVSAFSESDGLGGIYRTRLDYRNGFYDGLEREFRGFETATKHEVGDASQGAPTLITEFHFDTGSTNEAMKGKPLALQTRSDAHEVFYQQTNTWMARALPVSAATNESRRVTFAFQARKETLVLEKGPTSEGVLLEEEYGFDDFGNQTLYADYGRVENRDRTAWDDERIIRRSYSAAYPDGLREWILDRLVQEETLGMTGQVVARKQHFYDDPAFRGVGLGTVSKGNLTMVREWIRTDAPESFRASERNEFDLFGNVVGTYDPLGVVGHPELGHYRRVGLDPSLHTYPISETLFTANPDLLAGGVSPPSLQMGATYDLGLGTMTSSTDFNGNRSFYAQDTFGRLVTITRPGDTTNLPTASFQYVLHDPVPGLGTINWVESRMRQTAGAEDTLDSRTFTDGLGRKVMTRAESETNGFVLVTEGTLFNARRGAWRRAQPYLEEGTMGFQPPVMTNAFREYHYDELSRETEAVQPSTTAAGYRAFSRTVYSPLTRFVQDEEQTLVGSPHAGAGMRYVEDGLRDKDGKGRLRWVHEIVKIDDDGYPTNRTQTWVTAYRYSVLDDFLGYTDSQGNQKEFRYDSLRRKVFMNDPDRGVMKWGYDEASNLTNSVDAKGQEIRYAYDGVNRVVSEEYLDGQALPRWRVGGEGTWSQLGGAEVRYHYDRPAGPIDGGDGSRLNPQNPLGFLVWVEDLAGEEHTSYDARGRVGWVVKRIPDPIFLSIPTLNCPLVSYRTGFEYDSMDRLTKVLYPDLDEVSYQYNERGLLARIPGGPNGSILSNLAYQASGQFRSIRYGNGVETSYDYDSRLRLTRLNTVQGQSGKSLIDFAYQLDHAANITAILDNRPLAEVPAGDRRRNNQFFGYDDLYRLTSVEYAFGGPGDELSGRGLPADGRIDYRYDRIGNMLAQRSDMVQEERGLPVADLGLMGSGGALGPHNRAGRGAGEPPGPHALTRISKPGAPIPIREYLYDANGNMTLIDGMTNTWDFKDRLVAVESQEMRAEYAYDYTDRRVMKRVWRKDSANQVAGKRNDPRPSLTTLYPDKYFEVREHDAPVKYVWNQGTRVARVTGTLSASQRVQRLRIWPGWNLCSVAVQATNGVDQLRISALATALPAMLGWDSAQQTWMPVTVGEMLRVGTIFWLHSSTNANVQIEGSYEEPIPRVLAAGASFIPGAGLEVWDVGSSISNLQVAGLWRFDPGIQAWLTEIREPSALRTGNLARTSPGEAVCINSRNSAQSNPPDRSLRIRYYHQDHLGSTSLITDAEGQVREETFHYPFGATRDVNALRGVDESYGFTQQEMDPESGSLYFGMRYLSADLGRFQSLDPLSAQVKATWLSWPQKMNTFCYCVNRPTMFIDPIGAEEKPASLSDESKAAIREYTETLNENLSSDPDVGGFRVVEPADDSIGAFRKGKDQGDLAAQGSQTTPTCRSQHLLGNAKDLVLQRMGSDGKWKAVKVDAAFMRSAIGKRIVALMNKTMQEVNGVYGRGGQRAVSPGDEGHVQTSTSTGAPPIDHPEVQKCLIQYNRLYYSENASYNSKVLEVESKQSLYFVRP